VAPPLPFRNSQVAGLLYLEPDSVKTESDTRELEPDTGQLEPYTGETDRATKSRT